MAFLGAILRKKLFSGTPAIGETVRINGVKFTVIGAMDTKFSDSNYFTSDDESAFIPYTAAADLWDARYASVMLFEPVAPNFEADAMQQVRSAVASRQRFSRGRQARHPDVRAPGIQTDLRRHHHRGCRRCCFLWAR